MSVLLDALKKAAEDKKNADNLIADNDQDSSTSSSFTDSLDSSNLDLKLAVPDSDNSNIDPNEKSFSKNGGALIVNDEIITAPDDDLPKFSLKPTEKTESEDIVVPDVDFQIERQPEERLNVPGEPETSDNDLVSLIDSLDIEESVKVNQVDLDRSESSSANLLVGLSIEQQAQTKAESAEPKSIVKNEETITSDDFKWSMDELPAYEESSQIKATRTKQNQGLFQNPILTKGKNTPSKADKKYATSTPIIVSLLVMLLFIGIGFYGMLYYQEQNENLEFSMKKYNLSKMPLTDSKRGPEPDNVQPKSIEEPLALNTVTHKVIPLDSTTQNGLKNALTDNSQNTSTASKGLSNQVANSTQINSLVGGEMVESSQLIEKNSNHTRPSPKTIPNTLSRDSQYVGSKKSSRKLTNPTSSSNGAQVTIRTSRTLLSKAYSAYESGNFQYAQKRFTEVLEQESQNIHALLGLGGIAVAQGNYYSALNYYQKVLDAEPNNIYAFESIANLSGKMTLNKAWERELFDMSAKYPRSAVLQYAKGNIFAKKTDWLAAQDSYFNAYALDSANPDYMLNLAVSYDHLGKYKLAAHYYTQALGFAVESKTRFDQKHVRDRLISLRQFISRGINQ